jgi:hypothetical protein
VDVRELDLVDGEIARRGRIADVDVRRIDVPVREAGRVQGGDPLADRRRERECASRRQRVGPMLV